MVPALLDPPAVMPVPPRTDADSPGSSASSLLDLPEVRARLVPISVEACEALTEMGALPEPTELIRGFILKKMPKSPLHRKLTKAIYDYCRDRGQSGYVVFQEAPLRLTDSMPEPDAMIVRGEEVDFDAHHPTTAELVVEVAVSSTALDRANATLYAEAGVPEYWIVLGAEKGIEVYRQPRDGVYQQKRFYTIGETLVCESVPGLLAALADWFV